MNSRSDGGLKLFPAIEETTRNIAGLQRRMKRNGWPVVYVNDNSASGSPTYESWWLVA
jgi:hypothetical protein